MIESRTAAALSASTSLATRGPAEATHGVWHVFTEVGTQVMTLAAMEAALQRGDVSLRTLVWVPGMMEWEPLGEVANLQNPSLAAPVSERVSRVQSTACQGGGELACPVCKGHRAANHSLEKAPRRAIVIPAAQGAQTGRRRGALKREGPRRWRRAATLLAALVLTLLGGWRLAEAVAPQDQRFTTPGSSAPIDAT